MLKEGMINLLKPAGMTSHNAVSMLRKLTGVKRIGHTGTLDPMAAGVLPLGIGSAARITEYLDLDEKTYRCEMLLGLTTDTLDIWGAVQTDNRGLVSGLREEDVLSAFELMRGNIMQLPPQYSALKVDGKRLYEYARQGKTVEISRRPVSISDLTVVDMDLKRGRVCFDVTCSKGTYVRSLCQEAGDTLHCGGTMSFLLRMKSGYAALDDAVTIEELQENRDRLEDYIETLDVYLPSLGKLFLRSGRGKWFTNGGYLVDSDIVAAELPFSQERLTGKEVFEAKLAHLGFGEKLTNTYLVYEDGLFLGTTAYDVEESKYICGKVFYK